MCTSPYGILQRQQKDYIRALTVEEFPTGISCSEKRMTAYNTNHNQCTSIHTCICRELYKHNKKTKIHTYLVSNMV